MTKLLADYDEHRDLFRSLLGAECAKPILLFRGKVGVGKTTLYNVCLVEARQQAKQLHCAPIQLRNSDISVAEIFSRLGNEIGWSHFPRFLDRVAAFQQTPTVNIGKNVMLGSSHNISVALHTENLEDRTYRQTALTDACFHDLGDLPQPLLIALDTYEAAVTDVQKWVSGPFLTRVAKTSRVRVLITGQKIPDLHEHNSEWGYCSQMQDLFGVHEAKYWLPIVEAMNRLIDVPDPHSWMAGICHGLKGRPKDIMQVIENLPRRKVSA